MGNPARVSGITDSQSGLFLPRNLTVEDGMSRNLLLVSSSRCHPAEYLDHCSGEMAHLFSDIDEIVFVPYARPGGITHDEYTQSVRERFADIGISVRGIHEFARPAEEMDSARGVFIGGGNSFVLLKAMYENRLMEALRQLIQRGIPYMGTSAGSNIAGLTIGTSNDMPIVHPPTLDALGVVSFNINPHYPAAAPDPTHCGETRDDRIGEFHCFNDQPVLALHEDGMLSVEGSEMRLIGKRPAYVFRAGRANPERVDPGVFTIPAP